MRPVLAGLMAVALAPLAFVPVALAQTPAPETTPAAVTPPAVSAPAMAPGVAAPEAAPPAGTAPAATAPGVAAPEAAPPTAGSAPAASAPAAPAPETPPAPPAPPTDPMSIALMNALTNICIPAANGGDLGKLAKADGFRKSGDNWVYRRPGYSYTILPKGSTPNACQVELVTPVDAEAPVRPLVVAIHNWAALTNGWTLVRNDKHVADGSEFTTRTWEHNADGKAEALALTTTRKADGTQASRAGDTSTLVYSVQKS